LSLQIGKIANGQIYYLQPDTNTEKTSTGQFEILACQDPTTTSTTTTLEPATSTTTTEEPTTTISTNSYGCTNGANNADCVIPTCGALLRLSANDPSVNGFSAGTYIDGSTIYPGAGNFSMCAGQNPAAARIMTTNSVSGSGAYSSCSGTSTGENYDGTSAQYFINDSSLSWVPTSVDNAPLVPGIVYVGPTLVGRKFFTSLNGTYTQVGKIKDGSFWYKIPGQNGELSSKQSDIEVLACVSCPNGANPPFCCVNQATNKDCLIDLPCGYLTSYPKNDPNINGFLSGTYQDGSKVFPGTGDFSNCGSQRDGKRAFFS